MSCVKNDVPGYSKAEVLYEALSTSKDFEGVAEAPMPT